MEKCPICKSSYRLPLVTVKKLAIVKCNSCGLTFTKLPARHDAEKFNRYYYSRAYLSSYESRKDVLAKRFLRRLRDIEEIKNGGNLLDVGCSTGLFLRTVRENSTNQWKLFGIDINRESIKFVKTKVKASLFRASLHDRRFRENFFDCVTCFDVLEHDKDIKGSIKELYRILKPEGLLVIQAPNYKSAMAYLCGQNWDWWSVPDHVLHFIPPVLSKILEDNGFMIKRLFTWEPEKDFVENLRGTIKKKVTMFGGLNRILSKLSVVPLYVLWFILLVVEKQFNVGGLIVVYAVKNKVIPKRNYT